MKHRAVVVAGFCVGAATNVHAQSFLGITAGRVLYDVSSTTGAATNPRPISGMDPTNIPVGITYGATATDVFTLTTFGGANPNSLFRINSATGAATLVGATGISSVFEGDLRYDRADGMLYGLQAINAATQLLIINPATGAGIARNLTGASFHDLSGLAFDSSGAALMLDEDSSTFGVNSRIFRVNPATGAVIGTLNLDVHLGEAGGIEFDGSGQLFLIDGNGNLGPTAGLRRVNLTTGATTLVGTPGPTDFVGIASVPSPGAGLALAAGALGLTRGRRRT